MSAAKLPKSARCDRHPERIAVAKFRYNVAGKEVLERVCLNCGDVWWASQTPEVRDTLQIEELTQEDLFPTGEKHEAQN